MIDKICNKCQSIQKPQNTRIIKYAPPRPKVSLGFLYHLALDLQFSFQSIALLADFAISRQAKKFQIKLQKINDASNSEAQDQSYDENYVQIKFDGNPLTKLEAEYFAQSSYSKLKGGTELIVSMFGIGKTGIFISNNGQQKSVMLFSVDDRVNPNYYKDESVPYYVQQNLTKAVKNLNGNMIKKIIEDGLKIYHPKPQKILHCQPKYTKVIIFHPKIFITSNKIMFYEIRQSNLGHDIDTHYNPQKIQFLNKLGYQMSIHAQFRLSCYFSCLYLKSPLLIKIGDSQQPICKTTYLEYLETLRQNGALIKINSPKIGMCSKLQLYETTDKYIMQNNGILIYHQGRMINRFGTQYGRMLQQKFYKKKYRSPPKNIWSVLGIIEVDSSKFSPNLVKNKLINSLQYRKFVRQILLFLQNLKRKSNAIVIQNDEIEENQQQNQGFPHPKKKVKLSKKDEQYQEQ